MHEIVEKAVKTIEITREIALDGVHAGAAQFKVLLKRDGAGNLIEDELAGAAALDLCPWVLPDDFNQERLTVPEMQDGISTPIDTGRPVDVVTGTVTIKIKVMRGSVQEKKGKKK